MSDHRTVHTHQLNDGVRLSRLNRFRLRDARRRRDEAIQRAHDEYAHQVRLLVHRSDRKATEALSRGEPANRFPWPWRRSQRVSPAPLLEAPYGHALTPDVPVFRLFRTQKERVDALLRRHTGFAGLPAINLATGVPVEFPAWGPVAHDSYVADSYRLTMAGAEIARQHRMRAEAREVDLRG